MLESFFVQSHKDFIESRWRQKTLLTSEILRSHAFRELRPEAVGDRTRLDLMWFDSQLGIRGPAREDFSFDFYPVKNPDTASVGVLQMLSTLDELGVPLPMAQLRFREGLEGQCGLWIHSSNENIHQLLETGDAWLRELQTLEWTIEVGQKHKQIFWSDEKKWHLVPALAQCWLPSFDVHNQTLALKSYVSLFSQPGPEVNRALFAAAFELMDEAGIPTEMSWCEWGAGYGNLSMGFASRLGLKNAWSSEFDKAAASLLNENAREFAPGLQTLAQGAEKASFPEADFWLIDPPRSGFAELLRGMHDKYPGPQWILAFHCHQHGLLSDSTVLKEKGYKLKAFSTVDAFPGTQHHEVISLWAK